MSEPNPPCPNCEKAGVSKTDNTRYRCDDIACPVEVFDWNGKYTDSTFN